MSTQTMDNPQSKAKRRYDEDLKARVAAYQAREPLLTFSNRSAIWESVDPNVEVRGGKPRFQRKPT